MNRQWHDLAAGFTGSSERRNERRRPSLLKVGTRVLHDACPEHGRRGEFGSGSGRARIGRFSTQQEEA